MTREKWGSQEKNGGQVFHFAVLQTSVTDPNNNTTTFLYEITVKSAKLTKIIRPTPTNSTTIMTYDSLGRQKTDGKTWGL